MILRKTSKEDSDIVPFISYKTKLLTIKMQDTYYTSTNIKFFLLVYLGFHLDENNFFKMERKHYTKDSYMSRK